MRKSWPADLPQSRALDLVLGGGAGRMGEPQYFSAPTSAVRVRA